MLNYKNIFNINPFSMAKSQKDKWYLENQKKLSKHHFNNCYEYKNIATSLFNKIENVKHISELPFVHAEVFKNHNLTSTKKKVLTKTLTSSGTTKNNKSIILFLRTTAIRKNIAFSFPN